MTKEITDSKAEVDDLKKERSIREKFVSTLSHDIRSPLAVARLSAELLRRHPKDLNKHVDRILNAIDKADAMIIDLLDANKMSAESRHKIDRSVCDLEIITNEVISNFLLNEQNKVIINVIQNTTGHWDAELVRRILENLISNALKYGDPDQDVVVTINHKNRYAFIQIHNFGHPIDSEILKYIFNLFQRGHTNGKQGWGLGLTTVKDFTEILGGKLFVTSSETLGTTFDVLLPLS